VIESTKAFWEGRTGTLISQEDSRQMIRNISGFFAVLAEFDRRSQDGSTAPSTDGRP
jgi:hypothetical protein